MFKNKDGRVRSGWKVALMMIAFYVSLAMAVVGSSIVIYIIASSRYGIENTQKYEAEVARIADSPLFNNLLMVLMELFIIFVPIIAWRFFIKRPLSNMGLTPFKKNYKDLIVGLLFGIASITIVFLALIVSDSADVISLKPHFSYNQLIYLGIYILVGFGEEIFGRGYIMSALRQSKNIPLVVIISAIIFALMHSGNSGIGILPYINLALVGILFAYMYLRSGNIWMPIGYHITWNYFQGYVYGFKVSGTDVEGIISTEITKGNILNGGDFGPEGGLFVTGVILVGFIFVWCYYKKSDFDFLASEPPAEAKVPYQYSQPLQYQDQIYQSYQQDQLKQSNQNERDKTE